MSDYAKVITDAISDPSRYTRRRKNESLAEWQTRAVLRALTARRLFIAELAEITAGAR
jgi:hypothetical protein